MGFASTLRSLGDGTLSASFDGLRSQLPLDWLQSSLSQTGVATVRRRKLPAENVLWLLIGMALFRDRSLPELVDRLNLVLPDKDGGKRRVAKAAITPARDRVGAEPLKALFQLTADHWAQQSAGRLLWRGLRVLGLDGTTLRTPDTPANRGEFELFASSGYPIVRVVTLMALRSRLILSGSFAGCRTSEMTLARETLSAVPDGSITILDKYYLDYTIWTDLLQDARERHWLLPLRKDFQNLKVVRSFGPGDDLVEIRPGRDLLIRKPHVPPVFFARVIRYQPRGYRTRVLITSLVDPVRYPAEEIGRLYFERWELELAYRELKVDTLDACPTMRSQSPDRIRQELWGVLTAYNVVRREIEAVAEELNVPPNRISYRGALTLIRDLFFWAEVASPGKLPKMLQKLRLDLRCFVLPPRRRRSYPRHVKLPHRGYLANTGHPA